jgi:Zn ribbon nucleic-acid-binding protein
MSMWKGEADCPRCGGEGSLLVTGETSSVDIDGCWICGYGREQRDSEMQFVPLKKLRVTEERPDARPQSHPVRPR